MSGVTVHTRMQSSSDASIRVITKLGFGFWKQAEVDGYVDNLYRRAFP